MVNKIMRTDNIKYYTKFIYRFYSDKIAARSNQIGSGPNPVPAGTQTLSHSYKT